MRIGYFSWLRTKTGIAAEVIDVPEECGTVEKLIGFLSHRHPPLAEIADAPGGLRFTVNRRYVEKTHPLQSTDQVGFFPPVTGG